MSATFPNGTVFAIGATPGAAKSISSISNADPGVASATAHGFTNGSIVLLSVPSRLDQRPVRVANQTTDAFDLEGIDTTSTATFPTGFGVGSASPVATFTNFSQTVDVTGSGGEQQFNQWVYLEDGRQRQRPTFKNARVLTLTMHYDPALPWHAALLAADLAGDVRVLRATLPGGAVLYWSVYVGFDGQPSIQINENMGVTASFALACPDVTRYAS